MTEVCVCVYTGASFSAARKIPPKLQCTTHRRYIYTHTQHGDNNMRNNHEHHHQQQVTMCIHKTCSFFFLFLFCTLRRRHRRRSEINKNNNNTQKNRAMSCFSSSSSSCVCKYKESVTELCLRPKRPTTDDRRRLTNNLKRQRNDAHHVCIYVPPTISGPVENIRRRRIL